MCYSITCYCNLALHSLFGYWKPCKRCWYSRRMKHKTHLSYLADVGAVASQHSPNLRPHNSKLKPTGPVRLCDHRGNPRDALAIAWHWGLCHLIGGVVGTMRCHTHVIGDAALRGYPNVISTCVSV